MAVAATTLVTLVVRQGWVSSTRWVARVRFCNERMRLCVLHLHVRPPGVEARFSAPRFCRDSSLSTRVIRLRTSFGTSKGRCCALDGQPLLVSVPVDIQMSNGEVNQEAIDDFVVVSMLPQPPTCCVSPLFRRRLLRVARSRSNVTIASTRRSRSPLRAHLTFPSFLSSV